MKKLIITFLLTMSINVFSQKPYDYTLLTYSQVGYDILMPKNAMVQNTDSTFLSTDATFTLRRISDNKKVLKGKVLKMEKKWGKFWWKVDFSNYQKAGTYFLEIKDHKKTLFASKKELPIIIEKNRMWNKTWYATALSHLKKRDSLSYKLEGGWKDCGSPLQEVSSHIIMLNALCDLYELTGSKLSTKEKQETIEQMIIGANYVAYCQDLAEEIGYKEGAVVHEARQNLKVVTGNVAKTSMILARIGRIIKDINSQKSIEYIQRSKKSFEWIDQYGPVLHWDNRGKEYAIVHGAPEKMFMPPKEWMTRDLVMMMWAGLELYKAGETEYKERSVLYAKRVMARQVPEEKAEDGLYGHFYTYDSYDFTEKANIHCGAWSANYKAYNQGGHFPHYLIPMIEMMQLWPQHNDNANWHKTVKSFAYNYFVPATGQNPFKILPAGYYKGEGLLNFSGWYHGHNKIFGYAAGLAMEFYHLYDDDQFIDIAMGNLNWITGLHSGFHKNDRDFSASMIVGIGNRSKADWDAMTGTITNGFEAFKQFKLERPTKKADAPTYFGDEGGIHHPAGWISGLTRLYYYQENN
ncbi:cellulase N-terminal Ig-like domain-containing protein [Aureibaculum luteum]|uniref:cellulase N-terminal Ig-like domain-containing protein n=1 Tax=Aureibaculum luteum TaxID=1548456 RepID=UPI0013004CAA|nr:cellulase N-terminal Ig-like domain-containing protein [Aureibaculum luteum]